VGYFYFESGFKRGPNWRRRFIIFLAITSIVLGALYFRRQAEAPASIGPPVAAQQASPKITTPISWPAYGQSAYGEVHAGVLATSKDNAQPVPIASLAKVITALAILEKRPLKAGEEGPLLSFTQRDVEIFSEYVRKNGAVVPIEAGTQWTERQALQAMLMASGNNISDSLAIWAFGSLDNYVVYANQFLKEKGLESTTVADASGFDPKTTSTAREVVLLGIEYMQNPVLADITDMPETRLPYAGLIRNYNSTSNEAGIRGIKVGNTDEAGRCFLVADLRSNAKYPDTVSVAVVLGADHIDTAMEDARSILATGNAGYDILNLSR
jgi:D-alanyl-D-alanine carboxypeptidase (penicillin-binding protein 5/6)